MEDSDVEVEQNDELQQFLGTASFGKQQTRSNASKQIDLSKRAPGHDSVPSTTNPVKKQDKDSSDSNDDDEDEDDSDEDEDEFPTSHEMILKTHERAVTTVSLDASGARLVTGSNDCTIKLYDFASMTPTTIHAFKTIDPSETKQSANPESHTIHQASFNPLSANHMLVVSALPQAKVMTRDGDTVVTFAKGDMYLRDMHNTKGHISEVTAGAWHPTDRNLCVTASTDSTLRIWDVNNPRSQKEVIVHKSKAAGSAGRSRITAVAWGSPSQGGAPILVAAAYDGTLSMWSGNDSFHRPSAEVRNAHADNTWTSGIDISSDGRLIVTRGGDNTIKTWDTRKLKQAIASVEHQSTSAQYSTTNIIFSPNASSILTGSQTGHLHILNPATLKPELVTPITPGSPLIMVNWHEKLNQIVTGSANGETHVLYNPNTSSSGAKTVMSRAPKRRHVDDDSTFTTDLTQGISGDAITDPGSIPGASYASRHPHVGLTASGRSRDPRRPQVAAYSPFGHNNPDESYVRNSIPLSSLRDEDPREALLKYADKAENDPLFTNAWKQSQPKTIYAELSDDDDEDAGPDQKKQRR